MKKTILLSLFFLLSVCAQVQAKSYYIRISTNTSDWSNITADNVNSFIVDYDAATGSLSTIINAYLASDSVWIAKGTYKISGTIALKSGMIIRGSFAGTESVISARLKSDLDANGLIEPWEFTNTTEITSENSTPTFGAMNFPAAVTYALVDGITIKGVNITSTNSQIVKIFDTATGSIFKNSVVKDCNISGTIALNGAVYANNGTIQNCLIQSNSSTGTGTTATFGGGINATSVATSTAAPKVIGCVIRGNKTTNTAGTTNKSKGGGIFVQSISAALSCKVINCVIYNNEAMTQGGGLYVNEAYGEVVNCTVAKNYSVSTNGGIYLNTGGGLLNNIISWGNISGTNVANDIHTQTSNSNQNNLAYGVSSGTWGGLTSTKLLTSGATADNSTDGTGTLAPKFLNPTIAAGVPTDGTTTTAMTTANFQLTSSSPCINYADNAKLTALNITIDLLGNPRVVQTTADLGAYELPESLTTSISESMFSINCFAKNNEIIINGLTLGENVMIYGVAGNLISSHKAASPTLSIASTRGVYLVRVANKVSKVIVQ